MVVLAHGAEVQGDPFNSSTSEVCCRSRPQGRPGQWGRQFVVTFHDGTLECIAERMEGRHRYRDGLTSMPFTRSDSASSATGPKPSEGSVARPR